MNFLDKLPARLAPIRFGVLALLTLYVVLLLIEPGLSPSDEYAFLPTLQSGLFFPMYGKDFPYFDYTTFGRLGPLAGQEYNLAALFAHTPFSYFALNAIELIILAAALIYVLNRLSTNRALNYLAIGFLLTVPAVTDTYFKLLYIDKNVATLLAVFLVAYIAFQDRPRWRYFIAAVVIANIAIYYKEPVFIAVGVFCAAHLLFTWRKASWRIRSLDLLGMASGVVWVMVYTMTVLPNRVLTIPGSFDAGSWWLVFAKTVMNYGTMTDPMVILVVLPLAAVRAYQIFVRKGEAHALADPMLAAAAAYSGVFFVLNLYSPYYLLTVYVFALPALCHFLDKGLMQARAWKVLFIVTGLAVILNAMPTALHYLTYNKYLPINFNAAMDVLVREVDSRPAGERVRIFFDGVDRGNGRAVYFIAGEFLKHRGLSIRKFDFASTVEARDPGPFPGHRSPFDRDEDIDAIDPQHKLAVRNFPFTVFQPGPLPVIRPGDILVVSPQATKWIDRDYIENLKNEYEPIFLSSSPLAVPNMTTKTLMKYLLMKREVGRGQSSGLMVSQNIFEWPDYYIFVKR